LEEKELDGVDTWNLSLNKREMHKEGGNIWNLNLQSARHRIHYYPNEGEEEGLMAHSMLFRDLFIFFFSSRRLLQLLQLF
jgi:hypothetical protein